MHAAAQVGCMGNATASEQHDHAADILEDIEANDHAVVQDVDTDVSTGEYGQMDVTIAIIGVREDTDE